MGRRKRNHVTRLDAAASMAVRSQLLTFAVLAAALCLALHANSTFFVGPQAAASARLSRTAVTAAAKSDADKIMAMLPDRKYKSAMLPVEFTTGAVNMVSIVTPPISSEGIQGYFSLNIIFFFGIAMFTAGGLIEIQRFFPDATYL